MATIALAGQVVVFFAFTANTKPSQDALKWQAELTRRPPLSIGLQKLSTSGNEVQLARWTLFGKRIATLSLSRIGGGEDVTALDAAFVAVVFAVRDWGTHAKHHWFRLGLHDNRATATNCII